MPEMHQLALEKPTCHARVVELLATGSFNEAARHAGDALGLDTSDRYELALAYVLHHYGGLLQRFGSDLVQVECALCHRKDVRVLYNLEPCRACLCSELHILDPNPIPGTDLVKQHALSPSISMFAPWCHIEVLNDLGMRRLCKAVRTVAERLPIRDWLTYQHGREYLLRHYGSELLRWTNGRVWTERPPCGDHDLRMKLRVDPCRACGERGLTIRGHAGLDERSADHQVLGQGVAQQNAQQNHVSIQHMQHMQQAGHPPQGSARKALMRKLLPFWALRKQPRADCRSGG